jgi:GMP synthase PP-ATPase subunit
MYEKIGNLFDEVKVLIDENVDDKEDREEIYDRLYEIEELNKEIIFASREFIDEIKKIETALRIGGKKRNEIKEFVN